MSTKNYIVTLKNSWNGKETRTFHIDAESAREAVDEAKDLVGDHWFDEVVSVKVQAGETIFGAPLFSTIVSSSTTETKPAAVVAPKPPKESDLLERAAQILEENQGKTPEELRATAAATREREIKEEAERRERERAAQARADKEAFYGSLVVLAISLGGALIAALASGLETKKAVNGKSKKAA